MLLLLLLLEMVSLCMESDESDCEMKDLWCLRWHLLLTSSDWVIRAVVVMMMIVIKK